MNMIVSHHLQLFLKIRGLLFVGLIYIIIFTLITNNVSMANTSPSKTINADIIMKDAVKHYPGIKWITVRGIKKSLTNKGSIAVGFDVDDTVLYNSPCTYKVNNAIIKKYKLRGREKVRINAFINLYNNALNDIAKCDYYSIPKQSALALIHMHQQRGDQIYFITQRTPPKNKSLLPILNHVLATAIGSSQNLHQVLYTNHQSKAPLIKKLHIKIFYGDSDSDIKAAKDAKIRGIRLLRASNSLKQPLPLAGKYHEEVLVNSDY